LLLYLVPYWCLIVAAAAAVLLLLSGLLHAGICVFDLPAVVVHMSEVWQEADMGV